MHSTLETNCTASSCHRAAAPQSVAPRSPHGVHVTYGSLPTTGAARRSGFGCMAGRVRVPGHPSWSPFGSAPQSNHHVAPRVSMTSRSVWCTTSKLRVQAAPSLLEPARTTYSSEPSRFSAWESVFRLRSITSAALVHRGAARAAIWRCSGCWRGARGPVQGVPGCRDTPLGLVGQPWAAGHAATGLKAYKDSLRAKVNVLEPARRGTSLVSTKIGTKLGSQASN